MRFPGPHHLFTAITSCLIVLLAVWAIPVQAAEASDEEPALIDPLEEILRTQVLGGSAGSEAAPVVVNGEELFRLRGISTIPARKRARVISDRIEALAENHDFNVDKLHYEALENRHDFFAGDSEQLLLSLLEEDAELEFVSRAILADVVLARTREAIKSYRHERQPEVLRANIQGAILRTLGLVVTLLVVTWLFRRIDALLERQVKKRFTDLETKSVNIIRAEQVWGVFRVVVRIVRALITLFIAYLFLTAVLTMFPWTRYPAETALGYVSIPLKNMASAVLGYIPSLFFLILLYYITRYLLKLIYRFFYAVEREYISLNGFDADWSQPTYRIVRVVVILLALVVAYPYIPGSESEAFKGISIMAGVLISLGSTSVISNIIAGYTMTYRRAFKVGDRVKIGNVVGDVLEMRLLVTHVRSLKNEEVVIPNSTILNNEVINYSKLSGSEGLILHTTVGIGYEVPWRQVEAMLLQAADRTSGISRKPAPFVLQKALSDFAVNYELNVFCRDEKRAMALYSELHRNIQDVFNEHEISIMTPAYVADTEAPKIVPEEQWYASPAVPKQE